MSRQEILQLISRHVWDVMPECEGCAIGPEDSLADLGANSVDRAEILTLCMESLSLSIPRVTLFGAKSVGELADLLYEQSS